MADILTFIGVAVIIIGGIGFLIAAFTTSLLWGFGCLLLSPVSIFYLFIHWKDAKNPFFLQLLGIAIVIVAATLKTPATT